MLRSIVVIMIILFIKSSTSVEAKSLRANRDWAISSIYGDAPRLLVHTNTIDLTLERKSRLLGHKDKEKTLKSDFDDFTRSSFLLYAALWTERSFIAPSNFKRLYSTSLFSYLHNVTGWQGCKGTKARNNLCSTPRKSLFDPPLDDGDSFVTNYIEHPLAGMAFYLYFRARGYDRVTSGFGSFLLSALFEYTIEGWQQSPSFNDVIVTPGIGVPVGIIVEGISNWLANRNNEFLRAMSYVVNPMRILVNDEKVEWANLQSIAFRFNWY